MTTETLPDKLATMAQVGDEWALNELLRYHKRMIHQLSIRYMGVAQSMTRDDLDQEVTIAVMRCLESWKPGRGSSFFTYAYNFAPHKVTQMMGYTDGPVRIPSSAGQKLRKEYRETGRPNRPMAVSLFKPPIPGEDYEDVLLDEVEGYVSQDDLERRQLLRLCAGFIERLPPRDRDIFTRIMLGEEQMADIAAEMGCSRQYVHAVYKRALKKLQAMAKPYQ